ncbi:MAG TPA: hypothetical protein PKW43_08440 [Deltaproteobacteria bacterium]|nr:hypothetical protein [Deltaproteobacteria bacterium]
METLLLRGVIILCLALVPACSYFEDDDDDDVVAAEQVIVWSSADAGGWHNLGLKSDGTLWAWGDNNQGQLGLGDWRERFAPERVGADADWVSVSAGGLHSLALRANGTLWAWGCNLSGQLGTGNFWQIRSLPAQTHIAGTDWVAASAGELHSLGLKTDGTLWACGNNERGQLGDGTAQNRSRFTQVGADTDWVAVSAGGMHTLALKADGTLWAWGDNRRGQLGFDGSEAVYLPGKVTDETDWKAISAGREHSLALKTDGTLWAWGQTTGASSETGPGQTGARLHR